MIPNAASPSQTDQAREDFAAILDELAFLREQLARLPTRREVSWIALRLKLGALAAIGAGALLLGRLRGATRFRFRGTRRQTPAGIVWGADG
jgi:hypothetical protein